MHLLDPVGKGCFSHIIRKGKDHILQTLTHMTHGHVKDRSREDAIGSIRIFHYRWSAAQVSHVLELLDLSNAFGSVDLFTMDTALSSFLIFWDFK